MNQSRLDIIPRRITEEEENLQRSLRELQHEITSVERGMVENRKRLKTRQIVQEEHGLTMGEVRITDELIREQTAKRLKYLLNLQRKYIDLKERIDRLSEQELLQQSLEL